MSSRVYLCLLIWIIPLPFHHPLSVTYYLNDPNDQYSNLILSSKISFHLFIVILGSQIAMLLRLAQTNGRLVICSFPSDKVQFRQKISRTSTFTAASGHSNNMWHFWTLLDSPRAEKTRFLYKKISWCETCIFSFYIAKALSLQFFEIFGRGNQKLFTYLCFLPLVTG